MKHIKIIIPSVSAWIFSTGVELRDDTGVTLLLLAVNLGLPCGAVCGLSKCEKHYRRNNTV